MGFAGKVAKVLTCLAAILDPMLAKTQPACVLEVSDSKSAKAFTMGSFVILGLFIVLSYVFAILALFFVSKNDGINTNDLLLLVLALAFFTPIFFGIGFGLVVAILKKDYICKQIKLLLKNHKPKNDK